MPAMGSMPDTDGKRGGAKRRADLRNRLARTTAGHAFLIRVRKRLVGRSRNRRDA